MKTLVASVVAGIVVVPALLSVSATALAADPLVQKGSYSGFVPPEWRFSEICKLFADRVEIERSYGETTKVTETRPLKTEGLAELVARAAKERVEKKDNLLCDAPTTSIFAPLKGTGTGAARALVLYQSGGCGTPMEERMGPASYALREIINAYCPKTYGLTVP